MGKQKGRGVRRWSPGGWERPAPYVRDSFVDGLSQRSSLSIHAAAAELLFRLCIYRMGQYEIRGYTNLERTRFAYCLESGAPGRCRGDLYFMGCVLSGGTG